MRLIYTVIIAFLFFVAGWSLAYADSVTKRFDDVIQWESTIYKEDCTVVSGAPGMVVCDAVVESCTFITESTSINDIVGQAGPEAVLYKIGSARNTIYLAISMDGDASMSDGDMVLSLEKGGKLCLIARYEEREI